MEFEDINRTKLGFNRRPFIMDILNEDFNGSIYECATTLGMTPGYLNDLLKVSTKEAGCLTLSRIWRYAKKTGKDPYKYILVEEK